MGFLNTFHKNAPEPEPVSLESMTPLRQREWSRHAPILDYRQVINQLSARALLIKDDIDKLKQKRRHLLMIINRCEKERYKDDFRRKE